MPGSLPGDAIRRSAGGPRSTALPVTTLALATVSALVWTPHFHCDDAKLRASVGSTESASIGEPPPAARALAVPTSQDRRERTRLRQGHDRPVGQRRPAGIVAVRDPADRMAQDPDRRLGNMLVIEPAGQIQE